MADSNPQRRAGLVRWGLRGLALLAIGLGMWWLGDILLGANLHAVIPGRVYRGGQPTAAALARIIDDYGIRTVVNLRGCGNPMPWYLAEGRVVQQQGISLEDVSFSAIHLPSPGELRELIAVVDHAEYPLFLHCRHGSDRTGVAAVVILLLQDGVPYARARHELGLSYGHLAFGRTGMLDCFFDLYEDWLHQAGKEHTPADFRHWVLEEYRGGWCNGGIEQVEPMGDTRAGRPIGFRVKMRNQSHAIWQLRPTVTAGVHVYFRAWNAEGDVAAEGRAGLLEASVAPGATYEVTMVVPPLAAGRYLLAADLVEEWHCCFYQVGAELWEQELVVRE